MENFSPARLGVFASTIYPILILIGVAVSIAFWSRLARRDGRLLPIYLAGLAGAFVGAKVVYVAAEGWSHFGAADMWLQLSTGKSILGALPGGYLGVELAKKNVGYDGVTGDWFAAITPVSVAIGRIGCFFHGCCLGKVCLSAFWWTLKDGHGVPRWPAVSIEIGFNFVAAVTFFFLRRNRCQTGQHFHLYMIAYGLFRFFHEYFRSTPKAAGHISGYQVAALLVFLMGVAWYQRRARVNADKLL